MTATPDFATHYHRADRQPFLNLSDQPDDDVPAILAELRRAGHSERRFGPRYLRLRRDTEALLRERFVERGGQPIRTSPHYFVLGESAWFRGLYEDCAEIRLPLTALPSEATSVTWSDSVTSMGLLADYAIVHPDQPQSGQVFLLSELERVVAEYGLPDSARPSDYTGHQRAPVDHFIEVQLWTDEPVAAWR